jgi:hypothetical protein
MVQRPEIPADHAMSKVWSTSCSNRARSASGKATRTNSTRSGQLRTDRRLSTPHAMDPRVQTTLRSGVTQPARASLHVVLAGARTAIIERLIYRKQLAASPTVIPPEYRPTPSNTR